MSEPCEVLQLLQKVVNHCIPPGHLCCGWRITKPHLPASEEEGEAIRGGWLLVGGSSEAQACQIYSVSEAPWSRRREEGRGLDVAVATGFVRDGLCVLRLLQLFSLLIN